MFKNEIMSNYTINSKFFDYLNLDTLKNLLNETNNLLKETQDSIKSITEKSNDLFKVFIVLISALIGFEFTSNVLTTFLLMSGYYILVFCFLIYKLYSIVYPKSNALVGTQPRQILIDEMITNDANINEKRFLFVMLQNKQKAIDDNIALHHQLFASYKLVIKLLFFFIVLSIPIFFLIHLLVIPFLDKC